MGVGLLPKDSAVELDGRSFSVVECSYAKDDPMKLVMILKRCDALNLDDKPYVVVRVDENFIEQMRCDS
jgi:hypothetical protein